MLGKRFRRLGVWMLAKKLHPHTPKPQIQSVEPRKGSLSAKAIPCVLGEKGRIKTLMCFFRSVFGSFFGAFGVWER